MARKEKIKYHFFMKKIFLSFTALGFIALLGGYLWIKDKLNYQYQGEKVTFEIKKGQSFPSINQELFKAGIINDRRVFHKYTQYKDSLEKFKSGLYEITPGMNLDDLIRIFSEGQSLKNLVTIPEGKNLYEIADILKEKNIIKNKDKFIELSKSKAQAAQLKVPSFNLEGYLFPDTYNFTFNETEESVIQKMVSNFKSQTKNLNLKANGLTPAEVIVLASVVEKETGAKFERKTIAGVFFNRLKKKMKLQSDPTIIYGMWERYDGNIRRKDILAPSKFNTYTIPRLPIGPIANPGLDAIKAVLDPESHDYLYFVSKNNGTHKFSKTYKEHNQAVKKWQLTKKNKEGRSWRDLKQ